MSVRDFFSDLAEVARGSKVDAINTLLGAGAEDASMTTNDLGDAAKLLTAKGDLASVMGVAAGLYKVGLDFVEEREGRIESGLAGGTERGQALAAEAITRADPNVSHPGDTLRAFSDAHRNGMMVEEDKTHDYLRAFQVATSALRDVRRPTMFSELENQQQSIEAGFGAEVTDRCQTEWGYPTAAVAREAGVLDPLLPEPTAVTPDASEPDDPSSAPGVRTDEPEPIAGPEEAADSHIDEPSVSDPSTLDVDLDTETEPGEESAGTAPGGAEPILVDEPYAIGDGDLAAQVEAHDAWVGAEIAEDDALAASAQAVGGPEAYHDPETYASDSDMTALLEPYDWQAEVFAEDATLLDPPLRAAEAEIAQEPVTVPDTEINETSQPEPDDPEV